jgi:hypothetical protein
MHIQRNPNLKNSTIPDGQKLRQGMGAIVKQYKRQPKAWPSSIHKNVQATVIIGHCS